MTDFDVSKGKREGGYTNDRTGLLVEYSEKVALNCKIMPDEPANHITMHFLRGLISDVIDRTVEDPAKFRQQDDCCPFISLTSDVRVNQPIRNIFNGLRFETADGAELSFCMRDGGFELQLRAEGGARQRIDFSPCGRITFNANSINAVNADLSEGVEQ